MQEKNAMNQWLQEQKVSTVIHHHIDHRAHQSACGHFLEGPTPARASASIVQMYFILLALRIPNTGNDGNFHKGQDHDACCSWLRFFSFSLVIRVQEIEVLQCQCNLNQQTKEQVIKLHLSNFHHLFHGVYYQSWLLCHFSLN